MEGNEPSATNRRSVLKQSALGLAAASGLPTVSADRGDDRSRDRQLFETSLKILEKRGPEARKEFLEKHDIPHTHKKLSYVMYPPEARGDEGVSTQSHFDEDSCIEPENCNFDPDLECDFALTFDRYEGMYYCDLSARYRYQYEYDEGCTTADYGWRMDGPLNPLDAFGIIWEYDHWELYNQDYPHKSVYTSGDNVEWDNGSSQGEGAGFKADDRQKCYDTGATESSPYDDSCDYDDTEGDYNWSNWLYGGVEIREGSDWQSGDPVRGRYIYQYNDSSASFSVGVSYPWGVSVSFSGSTSTKQKDTQTEPDGRDMELTASDV